MFAKKKPFPGDAADQKLTFPKMGAKPVKKKKPVKDVENAADAKKPGDKKEDAKDGGKPQLNLFAQQAALALAKKKK